MNLTIGITFAPENSNGVNNYREAVRHFAEAGGYGLEIVELWRDPEAIETIDGILFTGGDDIDPARYGEADAAGHCAPIDRERDALEFALAARAEELGLPTLGICRGCQLLNVHRGGSLVTDIASRGGRDHTKVNGVDGKHRVRVVPGTFLRKIVLASDGEINSSHHQAVDRLGEGLVASARSAEDDIVEAIEWKVPAGKPFFLAVQWHPERMERDAPFASRVFETFLNETAMLKLLKHRIGPLATTREESDDEATTMPEMNGFSRN